MPVKLIVAIAGSLLLLPTPACGSTATQADAPRLRRPVALGFLDGEKTLCVANRRSGSVSLIDAQTFRVKAEFPVGRRLSDLAVLPDQRHVLVLDEAKHELITLIYVGGRLRVRTRLPIDAYPVSLGLTADGSRCFVASLWSRTISTVDLSSLGDDRGTPQPRIVQTLRLPFEPRKQLLLPNQSKLVVADSFGGRLAVVDLKSGSIDTVRKLPAHNIRGMALSERGDRILISLQRLNPVGRASFGDIHWGILVTNAIYPLPVKRLLDPQAELFNERRLIPLDTTGHGAGDPAGVVIDRNEWFLVALAGTDEVAFGRATGLVANRLKVGRRPTEILLTASRNLAFVANTFSDSVSVIDNKKSQVIHEISLGRMPELSPSDRGELLFYDSRLSHDNWFSCHSCHTDGHTNGLLADTLGDNSFGNPKRILSLIGVADTGPWAWNGRIKRLQEQVHKSVRSTLHGTPIPEAQERDIVAFLRTLSPAPALVRASSPESQASIGRGRRAFDRLKCGRCHVPRLSYTARGDYDVGLKDENGNRRFNPPSLRGIGRARGLFHDNRAQSLEQVFTRYGHQLDEKLPEHELADLLRFLRSL